MLSKPLKESKEKSRKMDFCDKNWSFDTVCTLSRQTNAEIAAIDIKTAFIMCSLAAFGQRLRILRPRSMHSWNERHRRSNLYNRKTQRKSISSAFIKNGLIESSTLLPGCRRFENSY